MNDPQVQAWSEEAARAAARGELDQAVVLYERLEEAEPGSPDWPLQRADCLYRLGDRTGELAARVRAGELYADAGRAVEAAALDRLALALDPSSASVRQRLIDLAAACREDGEDDAGPPPRAGTPAPERSAKAGAPLEGLRLATLLPDATPAPWGAGDEAVQRIPLDGAEDSEATVLEPEPEGPGSPLEMAALDLEDPAADAFRRTPLLGDLDPRALEALLGFARVIELADGELLQRTGDPAVGPYAVAHGAVVPFVETGFDDEEGPRRHEWRALEAGEFFGENALVSRAPERVCVRARGDVRLLWLPRQHLAAWIDGAPSRVRALLRLARRRLVDRLVETHPVLAPLATVPRDVLARECHLLEVEDGAAIVEQGRSAPAVFGVLSGRLSVVRSDEDREKIVAELESGELWGDSSTATGTPAPASVVAAGRAWVLEWPPDALRMRLGAAPGAHRGA